MVQPHKARKRFGQNFLIDPLIIQQILTVVDPKTEDSMLEIGPGLGAITEHLLPLVGNLTAIEIDRDLNHILTNKFATAKNFKLYNMDILKFNFNEHPAIANKKIRIVGNIPYNISTPLIFHLLKFANNIRDIYLMVQKEVALRLASQHGSKIYGRLSIMVQCASEVEILFTVPSTAFDPKPAVGSAFIKIVPNLNKIALLKNQEILNSLTTCAFNQRRKTISNALKTWQYNNTSGITDELLLTAGIDPKLRPEQISVAEYVKLSGLIYNK